MAVENFTTSTTWTAPAGVTSVTVECWGGGGGGGGATSDSVGEFGGGGAGGAYARKVVTVTPGNSYTVTVGTGGSGVLADNGIAGNPSWFSTLSTVYAVGGNGGLSFPNGGTGGIGSSATSIGDTLYRGGNGADGILNSNGGGGGGGAGSSSDGGDTTTSVGGSGGTGNPGTGTGGLGRSGTQGNGTDGSVYGAGGGGSYSTNTNTQGGNGAAGYVRLTYEAGGGFIFAKWITTNQAY